MLKKCPLKRSENEIRHQHGCASEGVEEEELQEPNVGRGSSRPALTYLVDRLLTLLVLLGLLLHLLPLLDVVDEREEVAQVDDERLRLDEDAGERESGSGRSIGAESLPHRGNTHRLRRLDGHELVVTLLPTDVAEGPVVPGVLGDVADLVDRVVMEEYLRSTRHRRFNTRPRVGQRK